MAQSRPPLSGKTRLYGLFADPVEHLQAPTVLNELFDTRGKPRQHILSLYGNLTGLAF